MNTVLITVAIICLVLGVVLGYLSVRRMHGSPGPPHGPWLSLLALVSLALLAARGNAGVVDAAQQRVVETESRVFAEILERYEKAKTTDGGKRGDWGAVASRAGRP